MSNVFRFIPSAFLAVTLVFIASETAVPQPVLSERGQLLTSGKWVNYEYFDNYDKPNARLVWRAGKTDCIRNLSRVCAQYRPDGTYTETLPDGAVVNGTWELLDNDSIIRVHNNHGIGVYTGYIRRLDGQRLEWVSDDGKYAGTWINANYE